MRNDLSGVLAFLCVCALSVPVSSSLSAQQRLDLGVQLSPQVMYLHSEPRQDRPQGGLTYSEGGNGVDLGFTVGAYLQYALGNKLSLRGGLGLARRRYRYPVSQFLSDGTLIRSGNNRFVYVAMELPVSVVYHFDYRKNNDRVLFGIGAVIARYTGGPQLKSFTFRGSSNSVPVDYRPYSLNLFAGYDRYLSDRFVLGVEPFVSYSPGGDVLRLESRTVAVADLEAGVALRIRFDN